MITSPFPIQIPFFNRAATTADPIFPHPITAMDFMIFPLSAINIGKVYCGNFPQWQSVLSRHRFYRQSRSVPLSPNISPDILRCRRKSMSKVAAGATASCRWFSRLTPPRALSAISWGVWPPPALCTLLSVEKMHPNVAGVLRFGSGEKWNGCGKNRENAGFRHRIPLC